VSSAEWSLAAVHDVVAGAVPDREMVICGEVRRTFGEVAARSRGLAAFLAGHGIGRQRERSELARWEAGQDPVALVLHNCAEYPEAMLGAYRARAVPFNVNQHYRATAPDAPVRAPYLVDTGDECTPGVIPASGSPAPQPWLLPGPASCGHLVPPLDLSERPALRCDDECRAEQAHGGGEPDMAHEPPLVSFPIGSRRHAFLLGDVRTCGKPRTDIDPPEGSRTGWGFRWSRPSAWSNGPGRGLQGRVHRVLRAATTGVHPNP